MKGGPYQGTVIVSTLVKSRRTIRRNAHAEDKRFFLTCRVGWNIHTNNRLCQQGCPRSDRGNGEKSGGGLLVIAMNVPIQEDYMTYRAMWLLGSLLFVIQFSSPLNGQAVSGSLTGEITDASGAALRGASIEVVGIETGVRYPTKTNEAGYFNVLNLIAGSYRVDVSAPGFRPVTRSGIQVDIGSVVRLDFRLELGNVQERITVTGEASLLETDKVEVGSTVTSKALESLPVEGRNPTALAGLQPGVVMNTNGQGIPSAQRSANYTFSVNGQRSQQNRQLLDGVDDTEGVGGAAPIVPMT